MSRDSKPSLNRVRLTHSSVVLLLLLLAFSLMLTSISRRSSKNPPPLYRDGVVLIAFRAGVQESLQAEILSGAGATDVKHIGAGVHVLAVAKGRVRDVVRLLKSRSEVRYAEPDYIQSLSAGSLPDDASIGNLWSAQNNGQSINGTAGTSGADEHSAAAWSVTTGTNSVVVAVLDSGVQYSHPDLATNMWNNPGGIGGCAVDTHGYNILAANCDPMDDDATYGGHGTHVAGILGALGNNAAGVAGVNWTTSIMAVKWVSSADVGNTSDLIAGMDWVLHAKQAGVNVRVVNDSATWAGTAISQALSDEIDLLGANDILFVAASGNTAQNNDQVPNYPCSYNRPTMICVAASDQNDNLWSSANFGAASVPLAAPGANIYSTLRASNYGYLSGGSMAAPQVAGAAALILSLGYQPVESLRSMILNNVDVLPSLSGEVGTGGRLNVCKAVPGCAGAVATVPANLSLPVVTAIPQQGSLLGASTGAWSGLPTTYSYQWNRCNSSGSSCAPIPGASGQTYALLAAADVQATLSVTVTASNSLGTTAAQSAASGIVAPAVSAFALSSNISSGSTLSGSPQWQATPANPVNFVQFYVDGVLMQTATTSPYLFSSGGASTLDTTTLSNGPHVLGLRALASDNRTYVFSSANVSVSNAPKNLSLPVISGSPTVGQTLSTSNGVWTSNPTSFSYGWQHCDSSGLNCSVITGATGSSYTVSAADSGFTIRSSVTAINSVGSATAVSTQTAATPGGKSQALALQGALVMGQLQTSGASTAGSGGTSVAVTISATTAGDLLLVGINSDASTLTSVTDNKSNTYTAASKVVSGGETYAIYYAKNIIGRRHFGHGEDFVRRYRCDRRRIPGHGYRCAVRSNGLLRQRLQRRRLLHQPRHSADHRRVGTFVGICGRQIRQQAGVDCRQRMDRPAHAGFVLCAGSNRLGAGSIHVQRNHERHQRLRNRRDDRDIQVQRRAASAAAHDFILQRRSGVHHQRSIFTVVLERIGRHFTLDQRNRNGYWNNRERLTHCDHYLYAHRHKHRRFRHRANDRHSYARHDSANRFHHRARGWSDSLRHRIANCQRFRQRRSRQRAISIGRIEPGQRNHHGSLHGFLEHNNGSQRTLHAHRHRQGSFQ